MDLLMMATAQSRISNDALAAEMMAFALSDTWTGQNPFVRSELQKIAPASLPGHLQSNFRFPPGMRSLVAGHQQSLLRKYPESLFALDPFDLTIICPSILPKVMTAQAGVALEQ